MDVSIFPWLSGAPLTAVNFKSGGIHLIAVGEVIRRLVSRICCTAVKPRLQEVFLPYGLVEGGVCGGLEAAIHTLKSYITTNSLRENLYCFKVDMRNAFNECHREEFLPRLHEEFPELFALVQWCYSSPGELRFGNHRILLTADAQQGDPLGPMLFFTVLLEFLDDISNVTGIDLQLWYLDDGTFVGDRDCISSLLELFLAKCPRSGLHINQGKYEIYWPSRDNTFPQCPIEIHRLTDGLELLSSPVHGSDIFFQNSVAKRIDKVLDIQSHLNDIDDPQVEYIFCAVV